MDCIFKMDVLDHAHIKIVLGAGTLGKMSRGAFGCHPAAATSLRPFPTLSCTT